MTCSPCCALRNFSAAIPKYVPTVTQFQYPPCKYRSHANKKLISFWVYEKSALLKVLRIRYLPEDCTQQRRKYIIYFISSKTMAELVKGNGSSSLNVWKECSQTNMWDAKCLEMMSLAVLCFSGLSMDLDAGLRVTFQVLQRAVIKKLNNTMVFDWVGAGRGIITPRYQT